MIPLIDTDNQNWHGFKYCQYDCYEHDTDYKMDGKYVAVEDPVWHVYRCQEKCQVLP